MMVGLGRLMGVAAVLALIGCGGGGAGGAEESAVADAQSTGPTAEQTYTRFCFSCHAAGIAGAPKVGNAEHWAPRIAKGKEALLATSIAGVPPGMPARGLCSQCSDEELAAAIDYMISKSQ
jgi:cytochrome c5